MLYILSTKLNFRRFKKAKRSKFQEYNRRIGSSTNLYAYLNLLTADFILFKFIFSRFGHRTSSVPRRAQLIRNRVNILYR